MLRKELRKIILPLAMIAVGLVGFLWEFTIVDNEYYTIMDTHYGNRIDYHWDQYPPRDDLSIPFVVEYFHGENSEDALQDLLFGGAAPTKAGYSIGAHRMIPGLEWLSVPKLPEGYAVEKTELLDSRFVFYFQGKGDGYLATCSAVQYHKMVANYNSLKRRDADSQWYTVGTYKVQRNDESICVLGVSNGFCFSFKINVSEGSDFTDAQIRKLGVTLAAPKSREVTQLVLVNVLRVIGLSMAASGAAWTARIFILRKKRPFALTEQ